MPNDKRILVSLDDDVIEQSSQYGIKLAPTIRFLLSWYLNEGLHDPKMPVFIPKPSRDTRHFYEKLEYAYPERSVTTTKRKQEVKPKTFIDQLTDALDSCKITKEKIDLFGYVTPEMVNSVYDMLISRGVMTTKEGVSKGINEVMKL